MWLFPAGCPHGATAEVPSVLTLLCSNLRSDSESSSTTHKQKLQTHTHTHLPQPPTSKLRVLNGLFFLLNDKIKMLKSSMTDCFVLYIGFLNKKTSTDSFKQIIKAKGKLSAKRSFQKSSLSLRQTAPTTNSAGTTSRVKALLSQEEAVTVTRCVPDALRTHRNPWRQGRRPPRLWTCNRCGWGRGSCPPHPD